MYVIILRKTGYYTITDGSLFWLMFATQGTGFTRDKSSLSFAVLISINRMSSVERCVPSGLWHHTFDEALSRNALENSWHFHKTWMNY